MRGLGLALPLAGAVSRRAVVGGGGYREAPRPREARRPQPPPPPPALLLPVPVIPVPARHFRISPSLWGSDSAAGAGAWGHGSFSYIGACRESGFWKPSTVQTKTCKGVFWTCACAAGASIQRSAVLQSRSATPRKRAWLPRPGAENCTPTAATG